MDTQFDDTPDLDSEHELAHEDRPERAPARDYVPQRRGRGGFDPHADAVASAQRYDSRQRTVLGLLIAAIMTAALAVIVSSAMWSVCGVVVAAFVAYLFYLRRQVRLEQEIRRRRLARLHRSRLGVESRSDDELRLVPERLRRPGAVVLEIDDEDPEFEHLDHYDDHPGYAEPEFEDHPDDYVVPRASGQ